MNLQEISGLFKKYKSDNDIYHDLMKYHVREILLVATTYDAFILEEEDQITEQIYGEYYQLNLTTAPRIKSASSGGEALEYLSEQKFDMVILTPRISDMTPFELAESIRKQKKDMPVFLLLYDNNDIAVLGDDRNRLSNIDKVFVWNRDAKIFVAMIKYLEDKVNADNDTKVGLVRVILLVENSIRYYSRYLPVLYSEIFKQTQRLLEEESAPGMLKVLRMHARPKILMAVNYEEAVEIFERYKDYLLCVISDVKYPKEGISDEKAGVKLIQYVRNYHEDLPALLQSSDIENSRVANSLNAGFINKNSESLAADLTDFITKNLGFGDFIFRDKNGEELVRATDMKTFKHFLRLVPEESLLFHANRNHFSAWLMARSEIRIAEQLQPVKVTDFQNPAELRIYLMKVFDDVEYQKIKGRIPEYDESFISKDSFVVRLADGSMGGKGRGIAFMNSIIQHSDIYDEYHDIELKIPNTAIIGTHEFDSFIIDNALDELVYKRISYEEIKKLFLRAELSDNLKDKLKSFLSHIYKPLAVRSSSLFEDSLTESFSGVYQTYLLPNNSHSFDERYQQVQDAVKLVFACVFSKLSRSYFDAINYKVEEEKMAVLIQEVVGNLYGDRYYPHFSGVAQSYNYYPVSYMKPNDGIVILGLGLGKYIIDGEISYRFCPKYPGVEIMPIEQQVKMSQQFFYGINMANRNVDLLDGEDITLSEYSITDAEEDGTLDNIVSVWDAENHRMLPGLRSGGPRIINFAHFLKFGYLPLAKELSNILDILQTLMGIPVEIEFAANLIPDNDNKKTAEKLCSLYILQVKPLIRNYQEYSFFLEEIDKKDLFLLTDSGMGNGRIDNICDIIYCDPDLFDKSRTMEMVAELEKLNDQMIKEERKYILIGPGRWGTRDRWLGIPVVWTQISNAKIIVETALKDFHVDASLGSHFFHNITSMNIGYFTVHGKDESKFIDWDWICKYKPLTTTKHFKHLRFDKPLTILMDGKKGISLIYKAK